MIHGPLSLTMLSASSYNSSDSGLFSITWKNIFDFKISSRDVHLRYRILLESSVNAWPQVNQGVEKSGNTLVRLLQWERCMWYVSLFFTSARSFIFDNKTSVSRPPSKSFEIHLTYCSRSILVPVILFSEFASSFLWICWAELICFKLLRISWSVWS